MRQSAPASVRQPGQPAKARTTAATLDAILDAAEHTFGQHGFEGASMRVIAEAADVAQALLHYHFRNKEALYEAVFERRAEIIRSVRQQRLDSLFEQVSPVSLEDVLGVLFMSLEDLLGARRGNLRFYVQMLAEVTISADDRSVGIMRRFYDPSAQQFVAAFRKVLPGLTKDQAVWSYLFAIGARMQAHAPSARASRLGATGDPRGAYALLVPFVAAGIRAVSVDPSN